MIDRVLIGIKLRVSNPPCYQPWPRLSRGGISWWCVWRCWYTVGATCCWIDKRNQSPTISNKILLFISGMTSNVNYLTTVSIHQRLFYMPTSLVHNTMLPLIAITFRIHMLGVCFERFLGQGAMITFDRDWRGIELLVEVVSWWCDMGTLISPFRVP